MRTAAMHGDRLHATPDGVGGFGLLRPGDTPGQERIPNKNSYIIYSHFPPDHLVMILLLFSSDRRQRRRVVTVPQLKNDCVKLN